jgi:hypothetical protein
MRCWNRFPGNPRLGAQSSRMGSGLLLRSSRGSGGQGAASAATGSAAVTAVAPIIIRKTRRDRFMISSVDEV